MLTVLLALSPLAQASGYYAADPGVRATGRAQAFTAGVDDLSAQLYNPAALIRTQRLQIMFNQSFVSQRVDFQRLAEGSLSFDSVSNDGAPYPIPNFAIGGSFGLPNTSFAFGLYTPFAPRFSYPADGPQRYSLTDSTVLEAAVGPSVAQRFGWLSVGAGLNVKILQVSQNLTISTGGEDDPNHDIKVALSVSDPSTISWNAGVLAEPTDWLSVGVQLTPPVHYTANGSFSADMSENFFRTSGLITDDVVTDEDINLKLAMPMIIRSGVSVRPIAPLELELDFVYSGWSIVQELVVTDVELVLHTNPDNLLIPEGTPAELITSDDIILPAGYKDTVALRLGGEYDLSEAVALRGGGLFETAAVPTKTLNLQLVDGVKYGYSLGATVRPWDRWAFDLAWAQTFLAPLDISNSEFAQIYVAIDLADLSAPPAITDGKIVGNGSYTSHINVAGVGVSYAFGKDPAQ